MAEATPTPPPPASAAEESPIQPRPQVCENVKPTESRIVSSLKKMKESGMTDEQIRQEMIKYKLIEDTPENVKAFGESHKKLYQDLLDKTNGDPVAAALTAKMAKNLTHEEQNYVNALYKNFDLNKFTAKELTLMAMKKIAMVEILYVKVLEKTEDMVKKVTEVVNGYNKVCEVVENSERTNKEMFKYVSLSLDTLARQQEATSLYLKKLLVESADVWSIKQTDTATVITKVTTHGVEMPIIPADATEKTKAPDGEPLATASQSVPQPSADNSLP
jgi:hypothetical protein